MADHVSKSIRSKIMRSVGTQDTGVEMAVRRLLHRLGYRYRLHRRDLPGTPDLLFPKKRKAIFVHGCFWHGHECRYGKLPKSRLDYWSPKIERNRERDRIRLEELRDLGWSPLIVWQCELKDLDSLKAKLVAFLDNG